MKNQSLYKHNATIYFHELKGAEQHAVKRNVYYNDSRTRLIALYNNKWHYLRTTSEGKFIFPIDVRF